MSSLALRQGLPNEFTLYLRTILVKISQNLYYIFLDYKHLVKCFEIVNLH